MKNQITILIPTYNRAAALSVLLTSLCSQTYQDFAIIISDQSDNNDLQQNEVLNAVLRVLRHHQHTVEIIKHLPRCGMAEQRQFLLEQSHSPYSLFLDDDLLLEPWVVANLYKVIEQEQCGFVGSAPIGLTFSHDVRPQEEQIEFWGGKVQPEKILPNGAKWQRYKLHNAANLYHVARKLQLDPLHPRPYKIAWVGACVLYNTEKLKSTGGFSFWEKLPSRHSGEDVVAQIRLMQKYGGCGIIPSGVYHQELPTTIPDRLINAPEYIKTNL